jgi:L-fuculose-phosphate aldolase
LKEKLQVLQACREIKNSHLVAGTWGNVSLLSKNGDIIITPSGIPYDELREEDLVICDKNGKVISGKREPSSELKMHIAIYMTRDDVKAIVHTHSLYASVASSALREIPITTEDTAMVLGGKIKVTNYKSAGTEGLANEASMCLKSVNATVLANHGQVGVGPTLEEAVLASIMCEKACEIYIKALSVNHNPSTLSEKEASNLREIYVKHYGKLKT